MRTTDQAVEVHPLGSEWQIYDAEAQGAGRVLMDALVMHIPGFLHAQEGVVYLINTGRAHDPMEQYRTSFNYFEWWRHNLPVTDIKVFAEDIRKCIGKEVTLNVATGMGTPVEAALHSVVMKEADNGIDSFHVHVGGAPRKEQDVVWIAAVQVRKFVQDGWSIQGVRVDAEGGPEHKLWQARLRDDTWYSDKAADRRAAAPVRFFTDASIPIFSVDVEAILADSGVLNGLAMRDGLLHHAWKRPSSSQSTVSSLPAAFSRQPANGVKTSAPLMPAVVASAKWMATSPSVLLANKENVFPGAASSARVAAHVVPKTATHVDPKTAAFSAPSSSPSVFSPSPGLLVVNRENVVPKTARNGAIDDDVTADVLCAALTALDAVILSPMCPQPSRLNFLFSPIAFAHDNYGVTTLVKTDSPLHEALSTGKIADPLVVIFLSKDQHAAPSGHVAANNAKSGARKRAAATAPPMPPPAATFFSSHAQVAVRASAKNFFSPRSPKTVSASAPNKANCGACRPAKKQKGKTTTARSAGLRRLSDPEQRQWEALLETLIPKRHSASMSIDSGASQCCIIIDSGDEIIIESDDSSPEVEV